MMFRGRFDYTIDPKGRVNIPSRFRDQARESGQETFIITNFNGCLYGFTADEWARKEEKLADASAVDRKMGSFVRFFVGSAVEVAPDKQGRILVPPSLRSYAGLDKDVVIIGMLSRFEIWSASVWQEEHGRFEREGYADPELVRELKDLGI